jgi:peptide/nickel transport system permease protein
MNIAISARRSRRTLQLPSVRDWGVAVGVCLGAMVVLLAILGPLLAQNSPTASVGVPGQAPGGSFVFGLDFQGRDVLSRLLYGGRSTLTLALAATVITYVLGVTIGLVAGYSRSVLDPILMRSVDVFLSIPALLVMLLFVTGLGNSSEVLVVAATLVLFPGVARIVRSATLEVSGRGYVEAAVARGEKTLAVLSREILPNISSPIVADLGIRFSWSIILIASVNFLGLGIRPPKADWGVMVSENRVVIPTNPMAVVAPSLMLAVLIVAVNLIGDGLIRRYGRSEARR